MSGLEDFNTVDQVADYLHFTPAKVAELVRKRRLGSIKEGAVIIISRADVDAYAAANRREPIAANPFGLTDSAMRRVRT